MAAPVASILAITLSVAAASAVDFNTTFPEDSNQEAIVRQLRAVLEPIDGAARVYAVVDCHGTQAARFPTVVVQAPSQHVIGDAIREIFTNEKRATVTIEKNGLARIKIGNTPSPLLQTKIHRLKFSADERYNIISAELAIEKTKEVQAAIRRLQLGKPVTVISENMQSPMNDVPHLPASIEDITFDEALDLLATTFSSVVFYNECTESNGSRYFSIDQGCIVCGPWRNTQAGAKRANMLAK